LNAGSRQAAFPYQDPSLAVRQRVADLLGRMTTEDKVGLFFHTVAPFGDPEVSDPMFGFPSLRSLVTERRMTHFSVLGAPPDGRQFAAWHNALQRIAAEHPLGIPVTLSSDPRHHFNDNPAMSIMAGPFSQWPEPIGLAAIGSESLMERFADIARQEYLAVGLRVALHPQVDLSTEPRWCRITGTFGEDAELTTRLAVAYVRGFQGPDLGPASVATMTKHFPGGGPQKDGTDPHFSGGREQVYPGGNLEYHLRPFAAVIEAGGSQIMPYYGMPVGTDLEEVGFAFNRGVVTGILRERLGFEGIVCTDWGLLVGRPEFGEMGVAKAWGVEHLSAEERIVVALDAGVDQFGGESCTEILLALVRAGSVPEVRLDQSAARILAEKFRLGLFDAPFVDEDAADAVVGSSTFRAEGMQAQRDSLTLLTNRERSGAPMLPLSRGLRVYAEGLTDDGLHGFAAQVESVEDADVAILRVHAPYEVRSDDPFAQLFHSGSLEFPDEELARITAVCAAVPTVVEIYLDRPAVLGDLVDDAAAIVANFGVCESALVDVLFGVSAPQGKLPFDLPRSMEAVLASASDVPFDSEDPAFRFGHGLSY
jgi:beta-glucosidase